jgi:hypothetical protein
VRRVGHDARAGPRRMFDVRKWQAVLRGRIAFEGERQL